MDPRVRSALVILACVSTMYTMSLRVFAETLAEAIRSRGLDISPEVLTNLNRAITSYATFDVCPRGAEAVQPPSLNVAPIAR